MYDIYIAGPFWRLPIDYHVLIDFLSSVNGSAFGRLRLDNRYEWLCLVFINIWIKYDRLKVFEQD